MQAIKTNHPPIRRPAYVWRCAFALMLTAAFLAACVHADVELGIEEVEDKAIRAEIPDSEPLRVSLEPVKASFKVDEPIRFNVRGNKTFFLYLYSIDNETDEVTLLLPTPERPEAQQIPGQPNPARSQQGRNRVAGRRPRPREAALGRQHPSTCRSSRSGTARAPIITWARPLILSRNLPKRAFACAGRTRPVTARCW